MLLSLRRDFYRQQGVPVQFTPFSKECSALWKTMTDEEKQKFQKMAEDDRERYRREVSGFDKPLAKDGTRRGRRKKEPGQPKRNMYVPCVVCLHAVRHEVILVSHVLLSTVPLACSMSWDHMHVGLVSSQLVSAL